MQIFLVTLMLVHASSKKMCLERHSTYYLKAQRTRNNMVPNNLHTEVRKRIFFFNGFEGPTSSPPVVEDQLFAVLLL